MEEQREQVRKKKEEEKNLKKKEELQFIEDWKSKMKQFEIKSHDGPGRYGKLGDLETPAIIDKDDFSIADDESSAYDVEKEIAQWSVNQTIEKAFY